MNGITQRELKKFQRAVEKEFPHDPALQQVHIARKIIAREAEIRGLSFPEYVISLRRRERQPRRRHVG